MPRPPILTTSRLVLRPTGWRDAGLLMRLLADPQGRLYLGGPILWLRRPMAVWHRLTDARRFPTWTIRLRDQRVGVVSVTPHKDGRDHELSYQILPQVWGRGLGAEAAGAVVGHARDTLGLPRLIAETQAANRASCRLLSRLGLTEVTRLQRFGAEQVIFATPDWRPVVEPGPRD